MVAGDAALQGVQRQHHRVVLVAQAALPLGGQDADHPAGDLLDAQGLTQPGLARLRAAMKAAVLTPVGEPVYPRYDAPWTPWFLRRNEIWFKLP